MKWHKNKQRKAGGYWHCTVKYNAARERYDNSDARRAARERYEDSDAGRAVRKRYEDSHIQVYIAEDQRYRYRVDPERKEELQRRLMDFRFKQNEELAGFNENLS